MSRAFLELWRLHGHEVIEMNRDSLTIGRLESSDINLSDDSLVSRLHAILEHVSGTWLLRDVGSRNGTWVNGSRVAGECRLDPGDDMRIGRSRMKLRVGPPDDLDVTLGSADRPVLTRREQDVLAALIAPMLGASTGSFTETPSTRAIAATLWVTEAAVKQHLLRLYKKFGIAEQDAGNRRMRLANEALGRGAVTIEQVTS